MSPLTGHADSTPSDRSAVLHFPEGFLWGAGTAAYQVEGATAEDGRGPSIWDAFCARPGAVLNGHSGDPAADHYHRYAEDVDLMARLGLRAYRFSVSWSRVQPDGRGPLNPAGLDFYARLVDALLDRGIIPALTLYHWDLPQALQEQGGWGARETAARFADYASAVACRLGDRVPLWATVNEPWCAAFLGHAAGVHAPGLVDPALSLRTAHHLMLAHGLAAQALRAAADSRARVSVSLNLSPVGAATDTTADHEAARRIDGLLNRMFTNPLLLGAYPDDVQADTSHMTDWSFVRPGDEHTIASPIDLLGVNYYFPMTVAEGDAALGPSPWPGAETVRFRVPEERPVTAMGWPIEPAGLTKLLRWLHTRYPHIPLLVSENGAAFEDHVDRTGQVQDIERVCYLRDHLAAVHAAITAGVDVRGYFVWSLLDNFEWALGYSKRFGITYVDYTTQRRLFKSSARWYRDVMAANAVPSC
ncbi:GH1 family beta-glucosidase [Streptomyces sp. NPDC094149]|uniref:GH1 family beta-glucosidase n=1 Tax=Streptomyces sp. NPDC094149 TaxID=3155079 RepID=UPI003332A2B1